MTERTIHMKIVFLFLIALTAVCGNTYGREGTFIVCNAAYKFGGQTVEQKIVIQQPDSLDFELSITKSNSGQFQETANNFNKVGVGSIEIIETIDGTKSEPRKYKFVETKSPTKENSLVGIISQNDSP